MKQMRMYCQRRQPGSVALPEGYTYRRFDGSDADIDAWIAIEKHGLIGPDSGREAFVKSMVNKEHLRLEDIYFICEPGGMPVASIAPIVEPDNMGYVHMVACMTDYRGLGLGTQLNNIAMNHLFDAGCDGVRLDTDDFRLPAIKSYLTAGFCPIKNDSDMPSRWAAVLGKLGVEKVEMVDEDGKFVEVVYAEG